MRRTGLAAIAAAAIVSAGAAQTPRGGTKGVMHDILVTTAEGSYKGTMELVTRGGKVTGSMHITDPGEITGKVAGTSKGGVLDLEFPYLMTERNCEGTVKMNIKMPQKPGRAAGTMEAVGCGRDPSQKLTGTVELVPSAPAKK